MEFFAIFLRGYLTAELRVNYGTILNDLQNTSSVGWKEIEDLIVHEKYGRSRSGGTVHDIGLIKLKDEILFNDDVQPIKLPIKDSPDSKFKAIFSGWGRLSVSIQKS